MFFNPTHQEITRTIHIPLYYTGLTQTARIREKEQKPVTYKLNRDYTVELTVKIPANGYTWYVLKQPIRTKMAGIIATPAFYLSIDFFIYVRYLDVFCHVYSL